MENVEDAGKMVLGEEGKDHQNNHARQARVEAVTVETWERGCETAGAENGKCLEKRKLGVA